MKSNNTTLEWSLCQRGDTGAWVVRYKDPTTRKWRDKRIPATAGVRTKREAEAWARDWLAELAEEPAPAPSTMTLAEYHAKWSTRRERNPRVRRTTFANNRAHATHHIAPKLGAKLMRDLTPPLMRDYVVELRDGSARNGGAPLAPHTVRNVVATLRSILDEAVEEGLLPANPMRSKAVRRELPRPESRAGRNVVIHLPKPAAVRLLACENISEERRTRYVLVLTGGFRDGEVAGFTCADVVLDGEMPCADVNKAFDTNWEMGPPKTENAIRKVPLHPLAVAALRAWKAHGLVLLLGRHPQPTDPLFPNEAGKHHRPKSAELLREDLAAAGCSTTYAGHSLDFHALRRSFATWLAEAEVPDGVQKRLMGHGAVGVTDKHYTAKTLLTLQAAVKRISLGKSEPEEPEEPNMTDGLAADLAAKVQQGSPSVLANAMESLLPSASEALGTLARPSVFKTDGASVIPGSGGFDSHALPPCRAPPTSSSFTPRAT